MAVTVAGPDWAHAIMDWSRQRRKNRKSRVNMLKSSTMDCPQDPRVAEGTIPPRVDGGIPSVQARGVGKGVFEFSWINKASKYTPPSSPADQSYFPAPGFQTAEVQCDLPGFEPPADGEQPFHAGADFRKHPWSQPTDLEGSQRLDFWSDMRHR